MKQYLKFMFILTIGTFMVACDDDNDDTKPAQTLENAKLSFDPAKPPVEIPTAMMQSSDPNAQAAVSYIEQANQMSGFISNLEPPANAVKSTTPIGGRIASGGRIAKTQSDVVVYTWTDGSTSVSYQISETAEKYIFELFWKFSPEDELVRVLHAEEFKTRREGFVEWSLGLEEGFLFRYEWREDADGTFYFDLVTPDNSFTINIVSKPDLSGSVKYFIEGELLYEMTWNSDGSGTWALFNDGSVAESGSWEV